MVASSVNPFCLEIHVAFTLLTYSLLQFFLSAQENWQLTNRFLRTLRHETTLGREAVVVYAKEVFGVFDQEEYTKILLRLEDSARKRMLHGIEARQQERQAWAQGGRTGDSSTDST